MKNFILTIGIVAVLTMNAYAKQEPFYVSSYGLATDLTVNPVQVYEEYKGKVLTITGGIITWVGFTPDGNASMMINNKIQVNGDAEHISQYYKGSSGDIKVLIGGLTIGGKPYFELIPKTEQEIAQEKAVQVKSAQKKAEREKEINDFKRKFNRIKGEIDTQKHNDFLIAIARISDILVTSFDTQRHGFTRSPYYASFQKELDSIVYDIVHEIASDVDNGVNKRTTVKALDKKLKTRFKKCVKDGVSNEVYNYVAAYMTKYNKIDVGEFTPEKSPRKLANKILADTKKYYGEIYQAAYNTQKQEDSILGFVKGKTDIEKYIDSLKN